MAPQQAPEAFEVAGASNLDTLAFSSLSVEISMIKRADGLLLAKGDQGVDEGGAAGGQEAGANRDAEHAHEGGAPRDGVRGADLVEQACDQGKQA